MKRAIWNHTHVANGLVHRTRYHAPDDSVTTHTSAPLDRAVSEAIKAMQSDGQRRRGLSSFAGDMMTIPLGVWMEATSKNPALISRDRVEARKARERWAAGEGAIWKIRTGANYVRGGIA